MNNCRCRRLGVWVGLLALAGVCGASAQLTNFTLLHSFGHADRLGDSPNVPVIEGSDGALYGVTSDILRNVRGTLFKVNKDGTGYTLLHVFGATPEDGYYPRGALIEASDGALYGTTTGGGSNNFGTVYRVNKDGSGYTIVLNLPDVPDGARTPQCQLVEASDGALYGTTFRGIGEAKGTIFKVNKDGSCHEVLYRFYSTNSFVSVYPNDVIEGRDGALYGTIYRGDDGNGVIFKVNKDGTGYTVLHRFGVAALDGIAPRAALLEGADGRLYGTTVAGGALDAGTVFAIQRDGSGYTVLYDLQGYNEADFPQGRLVEAPNGRLYGVAELGGGDRAWGTLFSLRTDGSDFALLRTFGQQSGDGKRPEGLSLGRDGVLYGTTLQGGSGAAGSVFKVNTNGTGYSVLVNFLSAGGDAQSPPRPLVEGKDSALYGISKIGGTNGVGTFFKVEREGRGYSVLRHFGSPADGVLQPAALVAAGDGTFYGAAYDSVPVQGGLLFRLSSDGAEFNVMHQFSFDDCLGSAPIALVLGPEGWLYGLTEGGGAYGWGTVFRVHTNGADYELLREFDFSANDPILVEGLTLGSDGWLYGTSRFYGGSNSLASIFRLRVDGTGFAVIYVFPVPPYSRFPVTVMEGSDGVLYGTTAFGGTNNAGTIFKMNGDGTGFDVLWHLGDTNGENGFPRDTLVEGPDGALYGSTMSPGSTLFKLNKDGTGYAVLRSLPRDPRSGANPTAALLRARDGAFYGAAHGGGDFGLGFLFRFGHALSLDKQSDDAHLGLTGIPGYSYELQWSTDLSNWTTLQSVLMPDSPFLQYDDAASPTGAAFYRLRVP